MEDNKKDTDQTLYDSLENFKPNEPNDKKIIKAISTQKYQGENFDTHELKLIEKALKTWEAIPAKCSKIQFLKIYLRTGMRLRETMMTMHVMLDKGCAASYKESNDSNNCPSIKSQGSCSLTKVHA